MSYQPLVLRLEIKSRANQIGFDESSKLDVEQSPSTAEKTRRRLMSGMKKRTPPAPAVRVDDDSDAPLAPTGAKHKAQVIRPQTSCRGRRTYSEVVVETLEGDRLSELLSTDGEAQSSRSSKAGSEPHDIEHLTYYYGNPFVEKTEGILHFLKYNDERLAREAQCRMLCMVAVPSQVTLREIVTFIDK